MGGQDYKVVCDEFRKQGYNIVPVRLNAKNYGDPQNRDRIFIIGFLNETDYHKFKEPEKIKLTTVLKDVLRPWVPAKYFLSQKMIDGFILHTQNQQLKYDGKSGFVFNPTDGNKIGACLNTATGNRPTDDYIKVGYINQNTQASSVANTLTAGSHGYAQGYVKIDINQVGFIGKNRQGARVYDTQCAVTLSANGGGLDAKTGLYFIKSNTKAGYETAKDFDCISLSQPNSITRRGRVGKGYAQTLTTQNDIGVIYDSMIRKLMPVECFILQGIKLEDIQLIVSDTQAYKIAGNAINVSVMRALLKALFKNETTQKINLLDFI